MSGWYERTLKRLAPYDTALAFGLMLAVLALLALLASHLTAQNLVDFCRGALWWHGGAEPICASWLMP